MTRRSWMVMLFGLALALASTARAQNSNAGDIRGTVTDSSGAVVPGVAVTVTNTDTGVVTRYITNSDGLYDTNSIIPGTYTLSFTKTGFDTFKRASVPLQVGVITVNATLTVGSTTEVVQVSSDAPILKTEDSQVSTTLGLAQLSNLPNTDPENGWTYLLKLLPGATSTPAASGGGGGGSGDQEPQADQALFGTMPYFASFLVDGGSIWLPHSANIDQGLSESVSEVNVIATDAPAQYGGGGSVFNVISKGGGSQFHGSAYDYFKNDDMNARDYFNTTGAKGKVRYNYFGGAIGGPVLKNKMFFFFNYQQLKNPQSSISKASEPTAAMQAGCFDPTVFGSALTLDASHGGAALQQHTGQCTAYDGNGDADYAIPTADFDPVAVNIQSNLFVAPNISGLLQNNYQFLAPSVNNNTKLVGKLDYNLSSKNRIDFTIVERFAPNELAYGSSPNCPVNCTDESSDGGNGQISDVYSISASLVNEFRYSFNREADYYAMASLNKGVTSAIGLAFSTADVVPNVSFSGTGAPTGLGPGTEALFIQNTFSPSDMVTWVKGKHILHFGGELLMEEDNSTPWGSINGASLSFNGQYTTSDASTSEVGYADFLLGDVQNWSTSTYPKHYMRAKNPSFFVQDDIKLRPSLTVNVGLRAETHAGATEKYNRAGGFDPSLADPVASTVNYPVNANGSVWFAGLNGARSNSYETKTLFMPRLGFAWTMSPSWVLRGGVGQYSALWSEDTVGGVMGFGSGAVGSASLTSTTTPVVHLNYSANGTNSTVTTSPAEYSATGTPLPIISGASARNPVAYITPANPQGSNGTIPYTPYNLPIQNGWQWTFGVQHRLPQNMVAEAQYVGSHWENMMFESDINQLPADKLGQGQSARPFPQFSGIGVGSGGSRTGSYNGVSNYESAQFMLHVPSTHGLSAELAYSWSSLKDDMDDSGWGNQFGNAYYQDAFNPAANYGPSNFDRRNSLKGSLLYLIPLGKGHQYLSSNLADAALGGWQASGDFEAESGVPFTPVMSNASIDGDLGSTDGNSAAALYPNLVGNPHSGTQSLTSWFNTSAYATPAPNTFGNNKSNSLRGPDMSDFDFAMSKSWSMPGWEAGKLQLRADAINVFNHPSFRNPNNVLGSGGEGQITATTITGRSMMLTGRFSF